MAPDAAEMTRLLSDRKREAATWGMEIKRWPDEDAEMLRWVAPAAPRRILEVGVRDGGWMWMIRPYLPAQIEYVALDLAMGAHWPTVKGKLHLSGVACVEIVGSSLSDTQTHAIRDHLAGGALDLLHIDANHDPAAALEDWDRYTPFVKRGGLVWMHDVHPQRGPWHTLGKICNTPRLNRIDRIHQCWAMHPEDPGKFCGDALVVLR